MKIFVTGATGYVGLAVAEALRRRGHAVAGLTRTAGKARLLREREIEPVVGDLRETISYARAARAADVLIHCAAEHSADYQALDALTTDFLLSAAAEGGRRRALIYTSGVWLYGSGPGVVDESMAPLRAELVPWRGEQEKKVLAAGGLVIRPGCVYGRAGGLTGLWFSGAVERGAASTAGDGSNHWATVHVDDCAQLYALAVESGLRGELFNATDPSRATVRELAEAASRAAGKGGKIVALNAAESDAAYGSVLSAGLRFDQKVSSAKARRLLRWEPCFPGFVADAPRYFSAWMAARAA